MIGFLAVLSVGLAAVGWLLGGPRIRERRRRRLRARPWPVAWTSLLERRVALYRYLPPDLKRQLHGDIHVFLAEKRFEGCGGLVVIEEMKVVIAAEACLLLLNRPARYFPDMATILVYPHPYLADDYHSVGRQYVVATAARAGESWKRGEVVLAWDHVERGAIDGQDGHNVVLHEFAHQLDQEDGAANGAPALESPSRYASWARVLSGEFLRLQNDVDRGAPNVLDEYGATNPAEFFAVATETFFEKPLELREKEPALYAELEAYYRVDPAKWMEKSH